MYTAERVLPQRVRTEAEVGAALPHLPGRELRRGGGPGGSDREVRRPREGEAATHGTVHVRLHVSQTSDQNNLNY